MPSLTSPAPLQQAVTIGTDPTSVCGNCRFGIALPGGTFLECHANAPAAADAPGSANWPVVRSTHWCGIWSNIVPAAPYKMFAWVGASPNPAAGTPVSVTEFPSQSAANGVALALNAIGIKAAIFPVGS